MNWFAAAILGCALVVGCDSKTETPSGAPANNPQATEKAAGEMKSKTEDAAERAKDAAGHAGGDTKKSAEQAADALKQNANSAAESVNSNAAAAGDAAKLQQVMDQIKAKKWDIAETTLKELETRKSSMPAAMQPQVDNARKMLDAAKAGLATTNPSSVSLPK
jgi:hypothetical protein